MQVIPSNFTVAEYCEQMLGGKIIVNRDYQRSPKVWPPAARSYLIESILLGFPIPKLSLYQRTDLRSRTTLKEIVDGQQRSTAILAFFEDELRLSGKTDFSGRIFSQLSDDEQARFLEYQLSVDIFAGATEDEIRQTFRRINSYTVPLNEQEKRHATHQGAFKWFMVDLSERYAPVLKKIGVFSETQLARMKDTGLLAEIVMAIFDGIISASEKKLDNFYAHFDSEFQDAERINARIDSGFRWVIRWEEIHGTALMKPYNFYTLLLAILHAIDPIPSLVSLYRFEQFGRFEEDIVLANLGTLAAAIDDPAKYKGLNAFVNATAAATNRLMQRQTRFKFFCNALEPELL